MMRESLCHSFFLSFIHSSRSKFVLKGMLTMKMIADSYFSLTESGDKKEYKKGYKESVTG